MLYSRTVATGWIGFFRGSLELELRMDLPVAIAWWSTTQGPSLGLARWGSA
jgi:hypothetical protein